MMDYYLSYDILLSWPVFMKAMSNPQVKNVVCFAKEKILVRKDVEKQLGLL
jgi:hypothetical protein